MKKGLNKPFFGIDLWHAVEFSRYGCALLPRISPVIKGRPHNLGHLPLWGQIGLDRSFRCTSISVFMLNMCASQQGRNYRGGFLEGQIEGQPDAVNCPTHFNGMEKALKPLIYKGFRAF